LDLNLFNFSNSIDARTKVQNGKTKYLLREVAKKYLPSNIITRDKTGFGSPIRKWMRDEMDVFINQRLFESDLLKYNLFNVLELKNLIGLIKNENADYSYTLWAVLALESWYRQFMCDNS